MLCATGVFCYAENFNGKLIDDSCYDRSHTAAGAASSADRSSKEKLEKECAPTASTSNFALETSAKKVYKFDHAGNTKATEAMQSGTLKPDEDGDVHVSVSGSRTGDTLKVDSIQGKSEHH
jgi:hypothetical protein